VKLTTRLHPVAADELGFEVLPRRSTLFKSSGNDGGHDATDDDRPFAMVAEESMGQIAAAEPRRQPRVTHTIPLGIQINSSEKI
jgi:hypothetical protein